jgi:hypothetical protein
MAQALLLVQPGTSGLTKKFMVSPAFFSFEAWNIYVFEQPRDQTIWKGE